ncbi:hypothetical protein VNO80_25218 [Phaseolus coccineus]|uniref:Uncharacterized protein n=1 Tax=Phaseolus coccineus TaxID=3886 RepID=A0AAN9QNS0_PHACN
MEITWHLLSKNLSKCGHLHLGSAFMNLIPVETCIILVFFTQATQLCWLLEDTTRCVSGLELSGWSLRFSWWVTLEENGSVLSRWAAVQELLELDEQIGNEEETEEQETDLCIICQDEYKN